MAGAVNQASPASMHSGKYQDGMADCIQVIRPA